MITFFENPQKTLFAVQSSQTLAAEDILKLEWLFGKAKLIKQEKINLEFFQEDIPA